MKGAIEYFVMMLLLMAGILFSFNFYWVYQQNHNAHAYRDQVANMIENFDGDLALVDTAMETSSICSSCTYKVYDKQGLTEIEVHYKLVLKILGIEQNMVIKGLSYLPQKSS